MLLEHPVGERKVTRLVTSAGEFREEVLDHCALLVLAIFSLLFLHEDDAHKLVELYLA